MTAWEETTTSAGESSISLSAVDENPPAKLARAMDYLRNCCLVGGCGVWIGFSVWSIVLLALGLPRPPSWPLVLGFVLFFGFFPVALLRSSLERVVRARATRRFVMTCSPSHFRVGFDGHSRAFEMKVDEIDRFETWAAHLTVARNDGTKYQLPAIIDPEIRAKLVERLGEMLDQARIGARIRVATRGDYRGHDGRVGKSVDESTDDSSPLEKREGVVR